MLFIGLWSFEISQYHRDSTIFYYTAILYSTPYILHGILYTNTNYILSMNNHIKPFIRGPIIAMMLRIFDMEIINGNLLKKKNS